MQTNTNLEAMPRTERIAVPTDPEMLRALEAHRSRLEQQTLMKITLAQAAAGLLRRGLEAAN